MAGIEKLVANFAETDIDEEVIIMRLDNGELWTMAGTAAAVWRLVDGVRDREAIIAAVAADYGVDEASIAQDVDDLLDELRAQRLVASA